MPLFCHWNNSKQTTAAYKNALYFAKLRTAANKCNVFRASTDPKKTDILPLQILKIADKLLKIKSSYKIYLSDA